MNTLLRSYHSSQLFDHQNIRKINTFVDELKDTNLSYLEFIRALHQMNISSQQIESALVWKYSNNYPFVNQSWSKILSINEIVYDYYLLNQYQQSSLKTIQSFLLRKENQKMMTRKLRNQDDMKKKITSLQYELNSLSDKIGRAQRDSISLSAQKQYESKKRQLHFLKRVDRSMKSLPVSKRRQYFQTIQRGQVGLVGLEKNPSSSNVKQKILSSSQKSQFSGLELGLKLMQEMQRIFLEYASKNTASFLTESNEGVSQRQMMKYKSFLLFVKDSQIDHHLKFQQRLNIFNRYSKCKKQFQFADFINSLQQICKIICHKKQIAFNIKHYRGFLYLCLDKIQEKRPSIFRRLKLKNYNLSSLKIHSGHYRQSMKQRLKACVQTREQKKVSTIDRLKLLKIQSPNIGRKSSSLKRPSQNADYPKKRRQILSIVPSYSDKIRPTVLLQNHSQIDSFSPFSMNSPKNEKQSKRVNESSLSNKSLRKDSYREKLSKIIDFSEQDIFLQKMLFQNRRKQLKSN